MKTKVENTPFTIDAAAIARGMLDLFSEDEKVVLRFGMLPAKKMQSLEEALRRKFSEGTDGNSDELVAIGEESRQAWHYSLEETVSKAMKEITLEIYKIGDLVV